MLFLHDPPCQYVNDFLAWQPSAVASSARRAVNAVPSASSAVRCAKLHHTMTHDMCFSFLSSLHGVRVSRIRPEGF